MAQYSFVKSAGNLLVPATPDAIEFLKTKVKIGAVLYADFSQARNPAFHRKYFSLLNLGFQYWEPTGGAISPTDKELVAGYVKFLAYYAGNESTLQAAADEYLQDVAEKRAGNISAAKSFEAFRAWVTIQSGHYTAYQMPDGSERKEPRSVSFAKWTISSLPSSTKPQSTCSGISSCSARSPISRLQKTPPPNC